MDFKAFIYAFLSAVLMGTIGVFSKLTGLPAEVVTFYRLFLGAGFVLVMLLAMRRADLLWKFPSWPVAINGCFLAGFIIFYVQAMNHTTMANAIMLVYLAPVAASVVAHFFFKEYLDLKSLTLICVAMFGFAMMMEFKVEFSRGSSDFIGLCYGLASLFCYAGFILINRIVSHEIHVFTSSFYQLFIGSLVMVPFLIPVYNTVEISHIPWLVGIGLFPGFLAIVFAVVALRRLPAATFGTIAYVEPVAVVIFGWTIFQEYLSIMQISGCLLIIASGITKTILAKTQEIEEK